MTTKAEPHESPGGDDRGEHSQTHGLPAAAGSGITCPGCGSKGRKVEPLTLQSLLSERAKARLNDASGFRFCKTQGCDVVYYRQRDGDAERFASADVRVPVFQKSSDSSRFVCYCFEHRVADIEDEVARTGASVIPDRITAKCRQGLDRCEEMNPQGACCLGNVRQVVKSAMAEPAPPEAAAPADDASRPDCCAPQSGAENALTGEEQAFAGTGETGTPRRDRREGNAGLWSASGAVLGAALASACCWLPLLLIGLGASAAGVGSFFEAHRGYFLVATALLLGTGFYFVYLHKPKCAPGEACEAPNPKLMRMNKIMLWVATAFVVAFAAFPSYVGAFFEGSGGPPPAATANVSSRAYAIDGMTCDSCASHLEETLSDLEGVASAEVSYSDKVARVYVTEGATISDADVIGAVESAGYRARPRQERP